MNGRNEGNTQSSYGFDGQRNQQSSTGQQQYNRYPINGGSYRNAPVHTNAYTAQQTSPQPPMNTTRGYTNGHYSPSTGRQQGSAESFGNRQGSGTGSYKPYGTADNNARKPELRDWQKTTRSAPFNINPFEEPESAPELKEQREDTIYNRTSGFWDTSTTGYAPETVHRPSEYRPARTVVPKPQTPPAVKSRKPVLVLTLSLLVLAVVLRLTLFSVHSITVIGNSSISDQEIINQSGIRLWDNILLINEKNVQTGIENNFHVQFRYLEKKVPGEIVLSVREREKAARVNYCGIVYTVDRQRMVLEESEDTESAANENLIEVKGLNIRSCMTGQTLTLMSSLQESVYEEIFRELRVVECMNLIREIDLSNTSSVYLLTRDDFSVSLGSRDNIHAKLHAMLIVRDKLLEMGYTGGTIDVSVPETPAYSPAVS